MEVGAGACPAQVEKDVEGKEHWRGELKDAFGSCLANTSAIGGGIRQPTHTVLHLLAYLQARYSVLRLPSGACEHSLLCTLCSQLSPPRAAASYRGQPPTPAKPSRGKKVSSDDDGGVFSHLFIRCALKVNTDTAHLFKRNGFFR